jgi:hypothetical protein
MLVHAINIAMRSSNLATAMMCIAAVIKEQVFTLPGFGCEAIMRVE